MSTQEFVQLLQAGWEKIFPLAAPIDWATLIKQHPQLSQEDWLGILFRIEHNHHPIHISHEAYLIRCIWEVEDRKRVHTTAYIDGEDELA